jgi:hypothetical protein
MCGWKRKVASAKSCAGISRRTVAGSDHQEEVRQRWRVTVLGERSSWCCSSVFLGAGLKLCKGIPLTILSLVEKGTCGHHYQDPLFIVIK